MQKSWGHIAQSSGRINISVVVMIVAALSFGGVLVSQFSGSSRMGSEVKNIAQPQGKGNRLLGIKTNMGEEGDFVKALNESMQVGNETQVLPQDWNELEAAPGKYGGDPNFLAIANFFYPSRGIPIHLALRPVHTSQKVVPSDLMDLPLDDPRTIERFKKLLDWVATQIPQVELVSLTIGSEVDIYMWRDARRWQSWINFYAAVSSYARKTFPGTLISCETTYASFQGADLDHLRQLHQHSDVIGVSYYPMKEKLSGVEAPQSVHADFDTIVSAIPKKPIIFYQIGYPSSDSLGSSPARQADFIRESFSAWDQHIDRIFMLNYQWMHETPDFGVDKYTKYYKYDTPHFRAFLGSLGLQSWQGKPKPAWDVLEKEAAARGFGS